jgi:hypothetical protein
MPAAMTNKTKGRKTGLQEPIPVRSGMAATVDLYPSPSVSKSSTLRILTISVLLAVFTLLLYSQVGKNPFVDYDDYYYVVENSHVKAGLTWSTLTWALTATEQSNWHPLTWLSHALDCQLYGLNPSGHHWTSLLIHALNATLLFLLLWRVTRATWPSLLVAALFALHPLNVESVAWVAERKNVLSTLFVLLALGAYGWYAQKPGIRRYLIVALLFVFGLASKPMAITLPFVLLLLDFWPLRRIENWTDPAPAFPVPQFRPLHLVLEKLPLLTLSAASAVLTLVAQTPNVISTNALPITVRIEASIYAYGMYLWKMMWPVYLAPIYPHPGRSLPVWQPLLSALLIVGVSLLAWKQRRSRPYLAFGWLWFLGTAVPIIGIVQVGNQVIADRYAYLPLIGIFIIIAWGASELAAHWQLRAAPCVAIVALVLAALSFFTWRQIGYWHSTIDLWVHALQVTKNNSMAENYLANDLFLAGRNEEAMVHLRDYARLEPLDPAAHIRVAADLQDHGQLPEAIKEYEGAIRASVALGKGGYSGVTPEMLSITYANLGVIYSQLGDEGKARASTQKALGTDAPAIDQMIGRLVQSMAENPNAQGFVRLGILLRQVGFGSEAARSFTAARRLDPRVALPPIDENAISR